MILAAPADAQESARLKPAETDPDRFDCVVKPHLQINLSSPISGVIARIHVDRGSLVKRGDVVAELNSEVEQANLALAARKSESEEKINAARLRIDFLTKKYERNQKLNAQKIVSDEVVDEARTELRIAEEDLNTALIEKELAALERRQAEAVLAQKVIRSTVDGIVTRMLLQAGEFTSEQTPIATIAAVDPLHVEAFLPVRLHNRLKPGMVGEVATEAPDTGRYPATIDVVDRVYDAASGTFGVRLVLANPDLAIPAGTRCELRFLQN